jgi:hypothetical protein
MQHVCQVTFRLHYTHINRLYTVPSIDGGILQSQYPSIVDSILQGQTFDKICFSFWNLYSVMGNYMLLS